MRIFALILTLVMSVAFAAEIIVAHKGISTVAFTREEEKEKETTEKKSTEEKFSSFYAPLLAAPLPGTSQAPSLYKHLRLPAGYYHQPFTPPDAF